MRILFLILDIIGILMTLFVLENDPKWYEGYFYLTIFIIGIIALIKD